MHNLNIHKTYTKQYTKHTQNVHKTYTKTHKNTESTMKVLQYIY